MAFIASLGSPQRDERPRAVDVTTLDTDMPRGTPWRLGSEASVRRGLGPVRRFATQLCLRGTDAPCRITGGAS